MNGCHAVSTSLAYSFVQGPVQKIRHTSLSTTPDLYTYFFVQRVKGGLGGFFWSGTRGLADSQRLRNGGGGRMTGKTFKQKWILRNCPLFSLGEPGTQHWGPNPLYKAIGRDDSTRLASGRRSEERRNFVWRRKGSTIKTTKTFLVVYWSINQTCFCGILLLLRALPCQLHRLPRRHLHHQVSVNK